MSYTINKLAKISRVSVRTLHYYDEIGLLKPAFIQENGYRYYEEAQLLRLQQILFFRELGFKLSDIQKLLLQNDFDNIQALTAHKKLLEEEIVRKNDLINTINKTIEHLDGKHIMTNGDEFYSGFANKNKVKLETFLVKFRGTVSEQVIADNLIKEATEEDKIAMAENTAKIFTGLTTLLQQGYNLESQEVQFKIKQHVELLAEWHIVNKELYLSYAELYSDFDEFRAYFDNYDPSLADFISKAMIFYANHNL